MAHQAGGYASGTSYREMFRQYGRIPGPGQLPEDAVNAFQIRQRANRTPEEFIAELRKVGPVAIQKWAYQFDLIKKISIPHSIARKLSLRYLMWIIHSRDTWMHRLDICRAAGRPFEQTAALDGRIVALIVRDAAQQMAARSAGKSIAIDLSGVAGGRWQIGQGEPSTVIRMDALDFCIFASGRYTFDETRSLASISGDSVLALNLIKHTLILF